MAPAVCERFADHSCDAGLGRPIERATGNLFGVTRTDVRRISGRMGAIPGSIETDQQPPMTVPLRRPVVGLASLFVGTLVGLAALSSGVTLARKLYELQVAWTPTHTRYAVVAPALATWALATTPECLSAPTAAANTFGAAGPVHLLVPGTKGFVVFGTF